MLKSQVSNLGVKNLENFFEDRRKNKNEKKKS